MKLLKYLLIVSLFIACQKNVGTKTNDNSAFVGKWNWVKSTGGLLNITKTPQNSGHSWGLNFNNDYTCFQSGDLYPSETGIYSITTETTPIGTVQYLNIDFPSTHWKLNYHFLTNDTLKLDDHIELDGLSNYFTKIE